VGSWPAGQKTSEESAQLGEQALDLGLAIGEQDTIACIFSSRWSLVALGVRDQRREWTPLIRSGRCSGDARATRGPPDGPALSEQALAKLLATPASQVANELRLVNAVRLLSCQGKQVQVVADLAQEIDDAAGRPGRAKTPRSQH
jgi:hypothetical protein